jgi:hypothetical protein
MRIFNPRGWVSAVVAVLFVSLMTAIYAEATVWVQKTFNDLVEEAEIVLAGTVTDKQSVWADDKSTIYTFVTLSDLDVIDGDYIDPTFVLRLEGGEVDDPDTNKRRGMKIPGTPEFNVGERVVTFVKNNTKAFYPFVGGPQGVFRVKTDATTGTERLYTAMGDSEIAGVDDEGSIIVKESDSLNNQGDVKIIKKENFSGLGVLAGHQTETEENQKKAEIQAMQFTVDDLKSRVEGKARGLNAQGKSKRGKKTAESADIIRHREGIRETFGGVPPMSAE